LSYLSESFVFWRGAIEYNFKLIKTVFHSGRFRVVFVPGALMDTDVTTIDFNKCYNQVYDIRELTDFCFSVPFVNNAPWKTLTPPVDVATIDNSSRCTGMLYVQVLNSLRNPATAADNIDVIVETRAGDDFQYGFYGSNDELPVAYTMYAVGPTDGNIDEFGPAQGCDQFFPSVVDRTFNPNQIGMGEAIVSTRQMLKRYVPLPEVMPKPSNIESEEILFYPQLTGSTYVGSGSDAIGIATVNPNSTLDRITMLFRFKSGSMRVMLQEITLGTDDPNAALITGHSHVERLPVAPKPPRFTSVPIMWKDVGGHVFAVPQQLYFPSQEGVVEIDVPYYQEYPIMLTDVGNPTYHGNLTPGRVPNNGGTMITVYGGDLMFTRVIPGEDFSFGYLMGPPVTGAKVTPPPSTINVIADSENKNSLETEKDC